MGRPAITRGWPDTEAHLEAVHAIKEAGILINAAMVIAHEGRGRQGKLRKIGKLDGLDIRSLLWRANERISAVDQYLDHKQHE